MQFTITHNSDYFAADKDLVKAGILTSTKTVSETSSLKLDKTKLPQTGSVDDIFILKSIGILLLILGIAQYYLRKSELTDKLLEVSSENFGANV